MAQKLQITLHPEIVRQLDKHRGSYSRSDWIAQRILEAWERKNKPDEPGVLMVDALRRAEQASTGYE